MEKRTNLQSDLSGSKYYKYKDDIIEQLDTFVYEISICKYWKNGFCYVGSKLIQSDKPLNIKKSIFKKEDKFLLEKGISMIAAPESFIRENALSEYHPVEKKKRCKKQA